MPSPKIPKWLFGIAIPYERSHPKFAEGGVDHVDQLLRSEMLHVEWIRLRMDITVWSREDKLTAGLGHSRHFLHGHLILLDVFDNVAADHEIE